MRAEALASIAENYNYLQLTWAVAKDATKDSEMRARIGAQMCQFDFFISEERFLIWSRSLQATLAQLAMCSEL